MTIDEAINVLRWLNPPRVNKKSFDDFKQAIEMAIEALEQAKTNCSEIPNNCPAADVVPVVRCDDCVYYGSRRWCELHSSVFDDNAFCSYGERKVGEQ